MNAIILYDSKFGNTEVVAKTVAHVLNGFGQARAQRIAESTVLDLSGIDFLILGSPTRNRYASPAILSFLDLLPPNSLSQVSSAVFDTRYRQPQFFSGSGAHVIANRLRGLGAKILLRPESFFVKSMEGPLVEGEFERATGWARLLWEEFEPTHAHSPVL